MPATMVDQREKIKKKHWLKNVSQQSPQKTKFGQKYVIQNLTFGILFLKILLRAYKFFVSVHTFQSTFLFLVRSSNRKSQSQQKLAKKVTHFIIQFRSKNLTRFTNLNSRTICSRNASKTLSDFTNFPENIFLFGFRHVSVWFHHFLTPKNHILEAL